jgi:signal transduction histidine kinase
MTPGFIDDTTAATAAPPAPAGTEGRPADAARGSERDERAFLLDDVPYGVVGVDAEGRCVSINTAARQFLGIDGARVREAPLVEVVADASLRRLVAEALRLAADGYPLTQEFQHSKRTIEMRSRFVRDPNRASVTLLTLEDVTWRRAIDARKDEFLALVSHELRTPLTVVRGYLDIFSRGMMGPFTPEQLDSIGLMIGQCDKLEALIRDLIRLRNFSRGVVEGSPAAVALDAFLARVQGELERMLSGAGMTLRVDVRDRDLTCWCSVEHLHDAIHRLADNAVKFARAGGSVQLSVRRFDPAEVTRLGERIIARDPSAHAQWVLFSLSDCGPGIPAERLRQVFDPFEQVEDHLTRTQRGLGMGLPLVREVVDRGGGTIWVDTGAGRGTRVSFTLPLIHTSARP